MTHDLAVLFFFEFPAKGHVYVIYLENIQNTEDRNH